MTNTTPSYGDLPIEDSWIEYLRTRLPYSFNCIEEKVTGRSRHFVLSEPVFLTGEFAAERHNYGDVETSTICLENFWITFRCQLLDRHTECKKPYGC